MKDTQADVQPARYAYVYFLMLKGVSYLAILVLIAGIVVTYLNFSFLQNAVSTTGSVLNVQVKGVGDKPTYLPSIYYDDAKGNGLVAHTYMSSNRYNFEVGQKLDILYIPGDPGIVKIDSWFGRWGLGAMFVLGAIFFRGIVLFALWVFTGRAKFPS